MDPSSGGRGAGRAGAPLRPRPKQYLAIRYSEGLALADAVASVGSRGDSYDNAAAESMIGLFKTELIRRRGPWRGLDDVELATLEWVDWSRPPPASPGLRVPAASRLRGRARRSGRRGGDRMSQPTSPWGDDKATTPTGPEQPVCPVCAAAVTPARRRRYCSDACRKRAWKRANSAPLPAPQGGAGAR